MLHPKISALLGEIEKLPQEQQAYIAEALSVEIRDAKTPPSSLDALLRELDDDITNGEIFDLDELDKLP